MSIHKWMIILYIFICPFNFKSRARWRIWLFLLFLLKKFFHFPKIFYNIFYDIYSKFFHLFLSLFLHVCIFNYKKMVPNRQNQPTQESNKRIEAFLAQRKKKIEEALWANRSKIQSINDLQKCARRHRHTKRC